MDKISVHSQDPYSTSDENTDIFLDVNIWQDYFAEGATISTKYVAVEDDIDVLLITSEPPVKSDSRPILIISGWFTESALAQVVTDQLKTIPQNQLKLYGFVGMETEYESY